MKMKIKDLQMTSTLPCPQFIVTYQTEFGIAVNSCQGGVNFV